MLLSIAILKFKEYLSTVERSPETIRSYLIELKGLVSFLEAKYNGPVYLAEVTLQDIEGFLYYLKKRGNAAVSRNRMVYIMRSFYLFAYKKGLVDRNISLDLERIAVQQKERLYLSDEEVKILINAIEHPLVKLVVTVLFYTGLRINECLNLTLDDVNLNEGFILIRNTKSRKDRKIPLHKNILSQLKNYLDNQRGGGKGSRFFATARSGRLSPGYVNLVLRRATERLGWKKKVTCHILRHSFASNLVKKDVSLVKIQKLLGHSNLKVTSVYTHSNMDDLTEAVNTL